MPGFWISTTTSWLRHDRDRHVSRCNLLRTLPSLYAYECRCFGGLGRGYSASGGSENISLFALATSLPIPPITSGASANCAEFPATQNGQCFTQSIIPWVSFGDVWESRLKMGNLSSGAGGPIQLSFTLLPPTPTTNGRPNHIPAFFLDNRSLPSGQVQVGESAIYSLLPNESVSVSFLYPPSGCDTHGENCGNTPDPSQLSYGSILSGTWPRVPPIYWALPKRRSHF